MKKNICAIFFILFLFFYVIPLFADNIRVSSVEIVNINDKSNFVKINYLGACGIFIDTSNPFLQGVEIIIEQPQVSLENPNSLAYAIYSSVNPKPSKDTIDYRGIEITQDLLPTRKSTILQIPTVENHTLKQSPYSKVINHIYKQSDGYLLIKLMPIMKGLTDELENAEFTIKIKPIMKNEGGVSLHLIYPEEPKPVAITLNGRNVEIPTSPKFLILPIGEHQIILNSNAYRSEMRAFSITQAQITNIEVALHSISPLLNIEVPEEVEVFLDKEKVIDKSIPIKLTPGKHTVKVKLGTYELIRQIDAEEGKTYNFNIKINLNIDETD